MWKISELETAVKPFPADADQERGIERPEFDDSGWDEIAVPLNWYLKYPEKQSLREPYVKGWYRTTFDLAATELKQRRVILKFDVIGCDATLFLNGREVGRHLGDFTAFELDVTDAARPDAIRSQSGCSPIRGTPRIRKRFTTPTGPSGL